jgi:hypothetical protein
MKPDEMFSEGVHYKGPDGAEFSGSMQGLFESMGVVFTYARSHDMSYRVGRTNSTAKKLDSGERKAKRLKNKRERKRKVLGRR